MEIVAHRFGEHRESCCWKRLKSREEARPLARAPKRKEDDLPCSVAIRGLIVSPPARVSCDTFPCCQGGKRKAEEDIAGPKKVSKDADPPKGAKEDDDDATRQTRQQFITEWKDGKLTARLSPEGEKGGTNKKAPPKTILWVVEGGKVAVSADAAPLAKGWPTWSFEKPEKDKVVFDGQVMTMKQVVQSKSAKSVGHLGGEFTDGKCPASLKAATGQKRTGSWASLAPSHRPQPATSSEPTHHVHKSDPM